MKRFTRSAMLAFVLIILAVMAGAASAEEPSIGKLPKGWAEMEPANEVIHRYFLYSEKGIARIELLMLVEELPQDYPANVYMKELKKQLPAEFEDYSPLEDDVAKVHGLDAAVHRFTLPAPMRP